MYTVYFRISDCNRITDRCANFSSRVVVSSRSTFTQIIAWNSHSQRGRKFVFFSLTNEPDSKYRYDDDNQTWKVFNRNDVYIKHAQVTYGCCADAVLGNELKRQRTHNEKMSCYGSFTFVLFAVTSGPTGLCGEIQAVSSVEQCVDDGTSPAYENGTLCGKKLVVAFTVYGDEVSDIRTKDLNHVCE